MKKKLLKQKEKAIIESFAKNFNKIKRLDENKISEEPLNATNHLQVGDRLEKINTSTPDTLTIVKIDGNKLFIKSDAANHEFQWTLDSVDDEIKRGKLKWFPKNESLDEINLKKGLATLGLAGAMMGAPKDAAAQMPQQQGIEKSIDSAQALTLPEKNRKAGKEIMDSYTKNPFTAHMWSEKSRENLRFFKTIKKLVDYYSGGGQVDDSDIEELGAMAQQSPVAADFLER
jgi:hypothetical protein